MGNTKTFHVQCQLRDGESLPSADDVRNAFRSVSMIVGEVIDCGERLMIVAGVSDSQVADEGVHYISKRFPDRWLHVERYDRDWSDFRVYDFNADGTVAVVAADNWHKVDP